MASARVGEKSPLHPSRPFLWTPFEAKHTPHAVPEGPAAEPIICSLPAQLASGSEDLTGKSGFFQRKAIFLEKGPGEVRAWLR